MQNRVFLTGTLVRQPHTIETNNGSLVKFFLETVYRYTKDEIEYFGRQRHEVTARQTVAGFLDGAEPGDLIRVEGRLSNRVYIDKTSGEKITLTAVAATLIINIDAVFTKLETEGVDGEETENEFDDSEEVALD
jgi:single-stranded DNA-binding protein